MTTAMRRGGPDLPYQLLAAVDPCPGGWLVVSARLQGITLSPLPPEVLPRFIDVLDYRPAFSVVALHLPIGLPDQRTPGGRSCDVAARRLLKWPRAAAIPSPPSRQELAAWQKDPAELTPHLSVVTRALMPRITEAYEHIGSYHQRTVFEAHPELSFFELNQGRPLQFSKRTHAGLEERDRLLRDRIPGVETALRQPGLSRRLAAHVLDGCAMLWTARRLSARAVTRLPQDPEWDAEGLRMELVF